MAIDFNNKKEVMKSLTQGDHVLKYASNILKNDREVVELAI
jgi:hypothetical protein